MHTDLTTDLRFNTQKDTTIVNTPFIPIPKINLITELIFFASIVKATCLLQLVNSAGVLSGFI
jgi:hypothetical protein